MSRLIETIRLCDGQFFNLACHQARMERSSKELYEAPAPVDLATWLLRQEHPVAGLYKCRVLYDGHRIEVSFAPYERRAVRALKVVHDDDIAYSHKFEEREAINRLFGHRGDCDDVLIVKEEMVTDSSYANIVFRKAREWYTPSTPLLEGTMRQLLLEERKIRAMEIRAADIRSFDTFKLINAMLQFEGPEIDVSKIVF